MSERQSSQGHGPSITLCRMRERVSEKGTRYWSGYASGARLTILPNPDRSGDDDPTHIAMCAQGDRTGLGPGQYGVSFPICKMWLKTSARGTEWIAGRLGLAKIALLPIWDRDPEDEDTHELKLTQAQAAPKRPAEMAANDGGVDAHSVHATAPVPQARARARPARPAAKRQRGYSLYPNRDAAEATAQLIDDPIPF
jgi:hypothetical protein